jgi:hypothetical protein
MNSPRLLKPDEISCRVQQVTDTNGAIILLYKDARTDMNLLDETYGAMNWKREHSTIDGNLYCTISIWDETKAQWVSKQDVGVESNTEATKGEASDAFKRAGFNWGIGRELYSSPFIFVQLEDGEWAINNKSGKHQATFRFGLTVKDITYTDEKEIKSLILVDKKGRERFSYGKGKSKPFINDVPDETPPEKVKEPAKVTMAVTPEELSRRLVEISNIQKTLNVTAKDMKRVSEEMGSPTVKSMTSSEYEDFLIDLKNRLTVA